MNERFKYSKFQIDKDIKFYLRILKYLYTVAIIFFTRQNIIIWSRLVF